MKERVLVAMSGGVDSSVACYLLKKKGYQCIGATIKTWPKEECEQSRNKLCCSFEAISSARSAARKLGTPHYVFDFSRAFKQIIKNYFLEEYKRGRTPNPCIYCNSKIKFGLLLKKARALGCSFIGSGHYARISLDRKKGYTLKKAKDLRKDQSYFLFNLTERHIKHILFPLGDITKKKVRLLAKEIGLKTYDRASSQDICFSVVETEDLSGNIIFRDGSILGKHNGIHRYTVGQRKGLGISYREPLYVTKIDSLNNSIYLGTKFDTYRKTLIAEGLTWRNEAKFTRPIKVNAKIRYGTKESEALINPISDKEIEVHFNRPVSSPTPGQAIVFYKGDTVLGGGWIREIC